MAGSIVEWQQLKIQQLVFRLLLIKYGQLDNLSSMQLLSVLQKEFFLQDKVNNSNKCTRKLKRP